MIRTTARLHVYQAPAEGHTQRDKDVVAAENAAHPDRWIDPVAHEELGPGLRELDGYAALFGDALAEYNAGQKRKDRRMTMEQYRDSVRDDTRGRTNKAIAAANRRAAAAGRPQDVRKEKGKCTSFEVVLSLGNAKPLRADTGMLLLDADGKRITPGRVPPDVSRAIQQEYIAGFQARNPNLFLCSAVRHYGEWARVKHGGEDITGQGGPAGQWVCGVDHVHMTVIPWGDGYKKGMSRQVSTGRALAALGFKDYKDDTGRTVTAWEQWQEAEREEIAKIAERRGYAIVKEGNRETAFSTAEYQQLQELEDEAREGYARTLGEVIDAQNNAAEIIRDAWAEADSITAKAAQEAQQARGAAQADREAVRASKRRQEAQEAHAAEDRAKAAQELAAAQQARQEAQEAAAAAAQGAQAVAARLRDLTQAVFDDGFRAHVVSPKSGKTVGDYLDQWDKAYRAQLLADMEREAHVRRRPQPQPKAPPEPAQEATPEPRPKRVLVGAKQAHTEQIRRDAVSIWDRLEELPPLDPDKLREVK